MQVMGKFTDASGISSAWQHRDSIPWQCRASDSVMTYSETKQSHRERKRGSNRMQKLCILKRDTGRNGHVSTLDSVRDPPFSPPNKRSRNGLVEGLLCDSERVPLVEIRRGKVPFVACPEEDATKTRDQRQPIFYPNTYNLDRARNAHADKRQLRSVVVTSTTARTQDHLEPDGQHSDGSQQPRPKPLTCPRNTETSRYYYSRDDQNPCGEKQRARMLLSEDDFQENHVNGLTKGKPQANPTPTGNRSLYTQTRTTQGYMREQAWELACALAHEYLNGKYTEGKEGIVRKRDEAWKVVEQQQQLEASEGASMDGIVNPAQAAAAAGAAAWFRID
eukprot:c43405_g1_i1 orf=83-1084(+)